MIKYLYAALLAFLLAGCQTMAERVADRARLLCFENGYGETSSKHSECLRAAQPVGMAAERRRALNEATEGMALIGAGLSHNGVTCLGTDSVVTCHE